MVMIRVVIEVGTTVWAQPTAVIATQRAERKVQHDRGTHHGVKVDSLLGTNPTGILVGLLVGVEVQLLDVKEKFLLDGVQTARALPSRVASTVPAARTPSPTDSKRRSSSSGESSGTPIMSTSRSAGAGTVR